MTADPLAGAPRLRRFYTALDVLRSGGDTSAAEVAMTAACTWHVGGFDRDYVGRDDVFRFLATTRRESDGTVRMEVHRAIEHGGYGASLLSVHAERCDRRLDEPLMQFVRFEGDRVAELWAGYQSAELIARFWD